MVFGDNNIMKIFLTLILITSMSIYTQANTDNVIEKKNPNIQEKKDAYPGVEWKPKTELDKDQNKYPGVEWKPKEGDPKPQQDANAYPGVEWSPKK